LVLGIPENVAAQRCRIHQLPDFYSFIKISAEPLKSLSRHSFVIFYKIRIQKLERRTVTRICPCVPNSSANELTFDSTSGTRITT